MTDKPLDPLGLFRDWVNQWETLVNTHGTELLAKPEVARAIQGVTAAGTRAQGLTHDVMEKALAAANLPSKADIEALGQRLVAIEATLARIEARLPAAEVTPTPARPKPSRTRTPAP